MTTDTKVAHTAGPWLVVPGHEQELVIQTSPAANAMCWNVASVWGSSGEKGPLQAEANARLIAAAPDLLGACKAVAILLNCGLMAEFRDEPWIGRIRAAIAKAECQ